MFTPAVQFLILCNVAVYLAENLLGVRSVGMLAARLAHSGPLIFQYSEY